MIMSVVTFHVIHYILHEFHPTLTFWYFGLYQIFSVIIIPLEFHPDALQRQLVFWTDSYNTGKADN